MTRKCELWRHRLRSAPHADRGTLQGADLAARDGHPIERRRPDSPFSSRREPVAPLRFLLGLRSRRRRRTHSEGDRPAMLSIDGDLDRVVAVVVDRAVPQVEGERDVHGLVDRRIA